MDVMSSSRPVYNEAPPPPFLDDAFLREFFEGTADAELIAEFMEQDPDLTSFNDLWNYPDMQYTPENAPLWDGTQFVSRNGQFVPRNGQFVDRQAMPPLPPRAQVRRPLYNAQGRWPTAASPASEAHIAVPVSAAQHAMTTQTMNAQPLNAQALDAPMNQWYANPMTQLRFNGDAPVYPSNDWGLYTNTLPFGPLPTQMDNLSESSFSSPDAPFVTTPGSSHSPMAPALRYTAVSPTPMPARSGSHGHSQANSPALQFPPTAPMMAQQGSNASHSSQGGMSMSMSISMGGFESDVPSPSTDGSGRVRVPTPGSPESDWSVIERSEVAERGELQEMKRVLVAQTGVFRVKEKKGGQGKRGKKRPGGRMVGSHLPIEKATKAKLLRSEGSCWSCCLQRDSCSSGETCARCQKRMSKFSHMEHSLGCDRTKLQELKVYFIPDILNKMHERQALVDFSKAHIKRFSNVCIVLNLEPIWGLPRVECKVYEFEPLTRDLLFQYQYVKNQTTGKWDLRKQPCPPIAMIEVENMDRQIYDQYLTDVADNYLGEFAGRFYKSEQDDFCARLLHLMVQYHRASGPNDEEKSLLHEIFRLLVATYIMGRSITIPRSQWPRLTKLKSHAHSSPSWATHISPRMTNKQLKYLWSSLFNSAMDSVLKRLQQSLRSSNGDKKWTSAFCAFLGLAMCFEDVQRTVHVFCESDAKDGLCAQDVADRRAEDTCRATDEKFRFMAALFRAKHSRFNPFRPGPAREKIGPAARGLVEGVEELVREKSEFLQERQHQEILAANQGRYTARLLARFLLPFWGPSREV